MIKALPPIPLLAALVLASAPAAAQERSHDGGYEYAAAGWRGSLDVSTAGDGMTYFAIETRKDGMRCNLFGAGRLSEDTITLGAPRGTGSLILRLDRKSTRLNSSH